MSAPPVPVVPEPSPIDAARDAFEHTRRALFPFRFRQWLVLGVVAFLEQCGRGGVGGTMPGMPPMGVPGGGSDGGLPSGTTDLGAWFTAHLVLIVLVAVGVLVLVVAFVALALWIGSRATFVYIDDVATGRSELAAPWRAHAEKASSYFAWRFGLAAVLIACVAGLVATGAAAALALGQGSRGGGLAAGILFVLLVPVFFLVLLASGLAALALRDFVAPLQVYGGTGCRPAVELLWALVRAHPVPFLVYVVLKIAFGIGQGLVLVVAGCLTCCLVLVPVVTQTFLQPLFFFERAWSLHFLRRMGYDLVRRET